LNTPPPEAPNIGAVNVVVHLWDGETHAVAVGREEKDVTPPSGRLNTNER
jgi:hypothetical protein